MILAEANKTHQKHADIKRAALGEFGRNELAILGTPCANIKMLTKLIISKLSASYNIAYVDADHQNNDQEVINNEVPVLSSGASLSFTDKINFRRLGFNKFQRRAFFNEQNLILINGNHFTAKNQIIVIDPAKPLEKKLERLTNVKLILLKEKDIPIPEYLQKHITNINQIPVLALDEDERIVDFILNFIKENIPVINGLVLAGGKSSRMKTDKGNLDYHGKSQREHLYDLLEQHCEEVYLSLNKEQLNEPDNTIPFIEDQFLNLGPMSGILSAFQSAPDAAWLTVACDLPFLSEDIISYLINHRNPSKMATAFLDPEGKFPQPLITIWEPGSYSILLQFLSQGYSCPRKALINNDVELLQAPDVNALRNINYPEEYQAALQELK